MNISDGLIESLLNEEEGSTLDFKEDQYPFSGASDDVQSELLKDILAFANAWRRSPAYILIGVREVKGGRSVVKGVATHLADHSIQQFVNTKTNRPVAFSYEAFPFEGKQVGIISIPRQERPSFIKSDFGKVQKQTVYLRRGSSTALCRPDEIAAMGKADAIDTWVDKQLDQQRQERNEQRDLSLKLHGAVRRPRVHCNFPPINYVLYLRIKNYGLEPAKDIKITASDLNNLPRIACLYHPIPFLAPEEELVYLCKGPSEIGTLPKGLTIRLEYTDLEGQYYEEAQIFDFNYLGISGLPGAIGVDLAREENSPLVREVSRIAECLANRRGL